MTRRDLLSSAVWIAMGTTMSETASNVSAAPKSAPTLPEPTPSHLPRWRGFNLLEKFTLDGNQPFQESHFDLVHGWGFNFVRLPMDYRTWIVEGDASHFNETMLKEIDQAVRFGRERGIHVNLNFHRAPGYCVNPPKEPLDLWND